MGGPTRSALANHIPDVVDGVVRGVFVNVTDISAVKGTQMALRESEERFRLTLEEAPVGMAVVGTDGRFPPPTVSRVGTADVEVNVGARPGSRSASALGRRDIDEKGCSEKSTSDVGVLDGDLCAKLHHPVRRQTQELCRVA